MKNNIFEYLKWRGDLSFEEAPFNEVDNLIFANLTYIRFTYTISEQKNVEDGITLAKAYELFSAQDDDKKVYRDENDLPFFEALSKTKRFKDVIAFYHQEEYDIASGVQFGATSYKLTDRLYYVAFRGTDSAVVGWKEDLDLVFKVVPAQIKAKKYLDDVSSIIRGKIYVGGHSKGGNLAVYAASHSKRSTYNKIIKVFNNDGPGFDEKVIKHQKIEKIVPKLVNYVPKTSIVSVLMVSYGEEVVIDSSNVGIMQHDPYSWLLMGGSFIRVEKRDNTSEFVKKTIKSWLSKIDYDDRKQFINGIFDVIYASEATEIKDIIPSIIKNYKKISEVLESMDKKTKESISLVIKELWSSLGDSISDLIFNKTQAHDE